MATESIKFTEIDNDVNKNALSSEIPTSPATYYQLLWVDRTRVDDVNKSRLVTKIKMLFSDIQLFTDCETFLQFFKKIVTGQVILITSGSLSNECIRAIHDDMKVAAIYIYCGKKEQYKDMKSSFEKIRDVYDREQDLLKGLSLFKNQIDVCNEMKAANFFNPPLQGLLNEQKLLDVCWFSLFLETLIFGKFTSTTPNLTKLEATLQTANINREIVEGFMTDFIKNYNPRNSVFWYLCDSPMRSIISSTLANRDIKHLFSLRFILCDMYRYISSHSLEKVDAFKVQPMSLKMLEELKSKPGGRLVFDSFLTGSTKTPLKVDECNIQGGFELAILKIHAEASRAKMVFGTLPPSQSNESVTTEDDVIFMSGSIFEIGEVVQKENNIWSVHLTLVENFNNPKFDSKRESLNSSGDLSILADLMIENGEHDKAKQFCEEILEILPANDKNLKTLKDRLSNLGVLPKVLCVTYKLESVLSPFSRAILDTLKDYAKDLLLVCEDQLESIDPSTFEGKSVSFFTTADSMQEIRAKFPGVSIFILANNIYRPDDLLFFESSDKLIAKLSDQIVENYKKHHEYHHNLGDEKEARSFMYKIKKIHDNFTVFGDRLVRKRKVFDDKYDTDPVVFWLRAATDVTDTFQRAREILKDHFQIILEYSDLENCFADLKTNEGKCVFLMIARTYPADVKNRLKSCSNVFHLHNFWPLRNTPENEKNMRYQIIRPLVSDLINHYEGAAKFYHSQRRKDKYRETLEKARNACLFMSDSVI